MKISKTFLALALTFGVHDIAPAQTLVNSSGTPVITFDFSPALPASEWATSPAGLGVNSSSYVTAADLSNAVQTLNHSSVSSVLQRITANGITGVARHNTAGAYLITHASDFGAVLLKTTLRNSTTQAISHINVRYNFAAAAAGSGEELPGHQVFLSTNGQANSWQPIPQLSGLNADAFVTATLFVGTWLPNTDIYLLWADDNGGGTPDVGYSIDNFSVANVVATDTPLPLSVALTAPGDGSIAFPPFTVTANAAGTPAPTSVSFYTNGVLAAADNSSPYSLTFSSLATGTYAIYAVAANGSGTAFSVTNIIHVRPEFAQYTGGTYTENFDGIGAAGTETPIGWFTFIIPPSPTIDLTPGDGSAGASAAVVGWNYGATGQGDRALGTAPTGGERNMILRLRNNTASTMLSFTLLYDGEVWRNYTNSIDGWLTNYVSYDQGASWIPTGFNFEQPSPRVPPQGAVDGNNAANRVADIGGPAPPPSSPIPPGGVIYVRWQDFNGTTTDGGLAIDNVRITGTFPPANDTCAGAVDLFDGFSQSINTANATQGGDPTSVCSDNVDRGVWYAFTPSVSGSIALNVSASFPTRIGVYQGSCAFLSSIGCGFNSVQVSVSSFTTYYFFVAGTSGNAGNINVSASVCTIPTQVSVFASGPTDVPNGVRVDYTVTFSGSPATSYDWFFDGSFFTTTFSPSLTRTYGPFDAFPNNISVTVNNGCGNGGVGTGTPPPCGAICLSTGTPVTRTGTDGSGANSFNYFTGCGDFLASDTKWFRINGIASTNAVVTVTSEGSSYSTRLAVYRGNVSTPNSLVFVACNANLLRFQTQPVNNYWLAVNNPGAATLRLNYGYLPVPPPPPNDACVGATVLNDGVLHSTNTVDATDDSASSCGFSVSKGIWFTYIPSSNGRLDVETCGSDFRTVLAIYSGSCASPIVHACESVSGPLCSPERASVSLPTVSAGTTYRILAGGFSGGGNISGNLRIRATLLPAPPNDSCPGAIALANGVLYSMSTTNATDDSTGCGFVVKGVWFTYQASADGTVTVETCQSDFPTMLGVFEGSCEFPFDESCNFGNGPSCSTSRASLTFNVLRNGIYRIYAGGSSGGSGNLRIRATLCPFPELTGFTTTVFEEPNGIRVRYQASFSGSPFSNDYDWTFSDGFEFLNDDDTVERFYGAFDFTVYPTVTQIQVQNSCGPNSGFPTDPPPCGAICLSLGTPTTRTGTDGSSPYTFSYPNFPSATTRWFKIPNTNFASLVTISTEGSTYDTVLGVFRGFPGNQDSLTRIAFNQDISASNQQSRLQFEYRASENYWIAVNTPPSAPMLKLAVAYDLKFASVAYNKTSGVFDIRSAPLPSLRYGLVSSTNVALSLNNWSTTFTTNFTGNASASNNVLRFLDTNPVGSSWRFYQIKLLP